MARYFSSTAGSAISRRTTMGGHGAEPVAYAGLLGEGGDGQDHLAPEEQSARPLRDVRPLSRHVVVDGEAAARLAGFRRLVADQPVVATVAAVEDQDVVLAALHQPRQLRDPRAARRHRRRPAARRSRHGTGRTRRRCSPRRCRRTARRGRSAPRRAGVRARPRPRPPTNCRAPRSRNRGRGPEAHAATSAPGSPPGPNGRAWGSGRRGEAPARSSRRQAAVAAIGRAPVIRSAQKVWIASSIWPMWASDRPG